MDGHPVYDHWKLAGKMNKTDKRLYISTPKTEAGIRKIPLVKEVRNALDEIKQYQFDNGIFCKAEIDGYTDFNLQVMRKDGFIYGIKQKAG